MRHYSGLPDSMVPKLVNRGDPVSEDFAKGPTVGETLPAFKLPDQNGDVVAYPEARGRGGALVLFHRSAVW